MKRGYVKLWRKSIDSSIFSHEGMWKLWALCLMKATHQEIEMPVDGVLEPVRLWPGQFVTGRYALHRDYHQGDLKQSYSTKAPPTPYTLIRWLQKLQTMQLLRIKTNNKYSIITICNWILYQDNAHQVSNKRSSSEHKQTHKEHIENIVSYLNLISGRQFQAKGQGASYINARLSEGYTVEDCKMVCDLKWNDPNFDKQYFRPTTLFRPSKFEGYLFTAREQGKKVVQKKETPEWL